MDIPDKYVLPCKTNGQCRRLELRKHGISVASVAMYGMNFIEFEPGNPKSRIVFRCCVGCKQPVDQREAAWLNDQIGFELPSVESLRERMARLRRIREKQ